jgi:hypothetical protein
MRIIFMYTRGLLQRILLLALQYHWTRSWANSIHFSFFQPTPLSLILMLPSYLLSSLNHLMSSGYYMYRLLNKTKTLNSDQSVFVCFLRFSQQFPKPH